MFVLAKADDNHLLVLFDLVGVAAVLELDAGVLADADGPHLPLVVEVVVVKPEAFGTNLPPPVEVLLTESRKQHGSALEAQQQPVHEAHAAVGPPLPLR